MLKELSVKEALTLLAEKYPESVSGLVWNKQNNTVKCDKLFIMQHYDTPFCIFGENGEYIHFAIEVPDEYRYMTQQECIDWLCLHGYKGHQITYIDWDSDKWSQPQLYNYSQPEKWRYRTIQEIDGKIVYGEPMEFKVKVKNEKHIS